jgi:catechol 2,3-dioxygenase-like lactoylglutathione lyase family enzyme
MHLNQVSVAVKDIEQSVLFYEKLGLELIVKNDHYARFIVSGNLATLSIRKTNTFHPSETVVYFETVELDKKIPDIKVAGLITDKEPIMQDWLWYETHLNDPDGNKVCIYHAGANRLNPSWRIKK